MNSIKVCEYSWSRSFHDDLILRLQVSVLRTNGPLVSSPEPKAHKVSLYDGLALASVRRLSSSVHPQFQRSSPQKPLNWPIKAKLHVEHP